MNDRDRMQRYDDVPPENVNAGGPGMTPANQPVAGAGRMNNATNIARPWTRWQSWVNVVLGIILFISPWYTVTWAYGNSSWDAWIIGVAIVIVALIALAEAVRPAAAWLNVILAIWLFISPWVLGFAYRAGMAWTAWIIGVLVFILALWAIYQPVAGAGRRRAAV